MKRILFVLLVLIEAHCIVAQTTIVCNAEGELPGLLTEKAHALDNLTISGIVSPEDIKAVNNYPQIKILNLTDASLSVIPDSAWCNLSVLQHLYLPKVIDTLHLSAISCSIDEIEIHLPGRFPHLSNYPVGSQKVPAYTYSLTNKNDDLLFINQVGIVSADTKVLYKAAPLYGYSMAPGNIFCSVEKVGSYAFSQLLGVNNVNIMFTEDLKEIANNAFVGFDFSATTRGDYCGIIVQFEGATPPVKVGEGNLNNAGIMGYDISDHMIIIVPDKDIYIGADSSWGELNLIDADDWEGSGIKNASAESVTTSYHDLMGRPVTNPVRGIYIKDGKKVILK